MSILDLDIRPKYDKLILETLRRHGGMSIAQLADVTNTRGRRPYQIAERLERENLVERRRLYPHLGRISIEVIQLPAPRKETNEIQLQFLQVALWARDQGWRFAWTEPIPTIRSPGGTAIPVLMAFTDDDRLGERGVARLRRFQERFEAEKVVWVDPEWDRKEREKGRDRVLQRHAKEELGIGILLPPHFLEQPHPRRREKKRIPKWVDLSTPVPL